MCSNHKPIIKMSELETYMIDNLTEEDDEETLDLSNIINNTDN